MLRYSAFSLGSRSRLHVLPAHYRSGPGHRRIAWYSVLLDQYGGQPDHYCELCVSPAVVNSVSCITHMLSTWLFHVRIRAPRTAFVGRSQIHAHFGSGTRDTPEGAYPCRVPGSVIVRIVDVHEHCMIHK